jgi:dTDP-4-dehydrorhamnose 3,5-epimerase-like enzyme
MAEAPLPLRVTVRPLRLLPDERGSLLKVLMRQQLPEPARFGEIYLTTALRGATRGLHYHERCHEWFCVVAGSFRMWLRELDPAPGSVCSLELSADAPCLVHVPPRVAHAFENHACERAVMLAYADRPYDPEDTDTFAYSFPVGGS